MPRITPVRSRVSYVTSMRPSKDCSLLLFVYLIAGAMLAPMAPAQSTSPQTKTPVVAPPTTTKEWTGDLDVLLKHRGIRIGAPYSKTLFYTVKGTPSGVSYEMSKEFEKYLNKKYPLQNKNLKIHVLLTVTPREKAAASLTGGTFDILIGAIAITSERQKLADFSDPLFTDVKEIVVTAPNSAPNYILRRPVGQGSFRTQDIGLLGTFGTSERAVQEG